MHQARAPTGPSPQPRPPGLCLLPAWIGPCHIDGIGAVCPPVSGALHGAPRFPGSPASERLRTPAPFHGRILLHRPRKPRFLYLPMDYVCCSHSRDDPTEAATDIPLQDLFEHFVSISGASAQRGGGWVTRHSLMFNWWTRRWIFFSTGAAPCYLLPTTDSASLAIKTEIF